MRAYLVSLLLSSSLVFAAYGAPAGNERAAFAQAGRANLEAHLPAKLTPEQLLALPPHLQEAWLLKNAPKKRSSSQSASIDTQGPTLTTFEVKPTVNAGSPLLIRVVLNDDMSGVKSLLAFGQSAYGRFSMSHTLAAPVPRLSAWISTNLSRDLPAGWYTIAYVVAFDEAGNVSRFYTTDLNDVGNAGFQVANAARGDSQPPSLVKARILTPRVSLSGTNPGSSSPAYAKVSFNAADVGDLSISGVKEVGLELCTEYLSPCFVVKGQTLAPGLANVTFTGGGQPSVDGLPPGDYFACYVYTTDWVGQVIGYLGTRCGGDIDMSRLFPDGDKITLVP